MATKPQAKPVSPDKADIKARQIEIILDLISRGIVLLAILRAPDMPSRSEFYRWLEADAELLGRFRRARDDGHDAIAESTLDIADDNENDTTVDEEGNVRVNHDVIARSRLRVDTRMKLLSKWSPAKYGDKLDLNHGGQPDNPITIVETVIVQHEVKK